MKESMKHTCVTFVYFKDTGKYYSEGEVSVPYEPPYDKDSDAPEPVPFWEILERVRGMLRAGIRPGLIDGQDFHTLVTIYTEFGPLSYLYVRDQNGNLLAQEERMK